MNLEGKINTIKNAQVDIKAAIEAKGVIPSGNISTYASAIGEIDTTNNDSLTITPTTTSQTFRPTGEYTGYGVVTVNAVTSAIDPSIVAGNIKTGVSVLGVNGSCNELIGESRNVALTSVLGNTFYPTEGKTGITSITVTPTNQNRTVTPTTSQQTLSVNSGYSGNGTITVNAVTSAIDSNIQPSNIKKNVVILGTTGTFEGSGLNIKMSSNGTMDGNYFAVDASVANIWRAFDGDNNTSCNAGGGVGFTLTFYSPIKLVLTGIKGIVGTDMTYYIGGTTVISGSNDNINWTQIVRKEDIPLNSQNGITFSNTNTYKYYKFEKLYCSYSPLYTIELTGYFA